MVKTISAMEIQLKKKKEERDPLEEKPQLEQQRTKLVERHYQDFAKLMQLTKSQWEGVRERGVLQLAVREAEMQVGFLVGSAGHKLPPWWVLEKIKMQLLLVRSVVLPFGCQACVIPANGMLAHLISLCMSADCCPGECQE